MTGGAQGRIDAANELAARLGLKEPDSEEKKKQEAKKDPLQEMQEMIEQETDIAKRDYMLSKLRELKAESDARTREAKERTGVPAQTEESTSERPTVGGWSVLNGMPVKDPEGELTFTQALKLCEMQKPKESDTGPLAILKWMKGENLLGGGQNADFMAAFMNNLAKQSVENIVRPNTGGGSTETEALRAELRELRQSLREATDPAVAAKRVKDMFDAYRELGLVPEGKGGGD